MYPIGAQVKIVKPCHPLFAEVGRVVTVNPIKEEYRVVIYTGLEMHSEIFTSDELELIKRIGYF